MTHPADTPLARAAKALGERMAGFDTADATDEAAINRERGWLEAIAHLSKRGGLTHAGQEEARQMVAASAEWFHDLTDDGRVR